MKRWCASVILVALLCACGEREAPPPSMTDTPDAAAVAAALDSDVKALGQLGPAQRRAAEAEFGARLRRDLEACRGTRYENQPVYMLAQWLMVHGGDEGPPEALRLLDRLDILPHPAFRNAGRSLRVEALLRLGRTGDARVVATTLDREVPEFAALRRVAFHEQVGLPAPALPGLAVGGGPADDGQGLVLVCFLQLTDPGSEALVTSLRKALPVSGARLIAAVNGGDMLSAAAASAAWGCEVRWLRQDDPAYAAWRVFGLPCSVLLGPGPQRVIVAVDPRLSDLARLGPAQPAAP
ncbi:MAG TPA: hypothetical protein DCS97_02600 [Planctomycetes bacterium]|nr:hypothetical protein [Planctomycetota bacterium]